MDKSLIWNPHRYALSRASAKGELEFKKYLRNTSSGFIKKKKVREYVFSKFDAKCCYCGSTTEPQVDHIYAVYNATKENIHYINSLENLQLLCRKCNASKQPKQSL